MILGLVLVDLGAVLVVFVVVLDGPEYYSSGPGVAFGSPRRALVILGLVLVVRGGFWRGML